MGGAVPERADEGRKMLGNAWRAGEIKAFWFFEPVESLGGRMAARKEERTRAASSVRSETTPLLRHSGRGRPHTRHYAGVISVP